MILVDSKKLFDKLVSQYETKYGDRFFLLEKGVDKMEGLCELVDFLALELGPEFPDFEFNDEYDEYDKGVSSEDVDVFIDATRGCGVIYIDVIDFVMKGGRNHPFFKGIKSADRIMFSKTKDGKVRISFLVEGLCGLR